MDNVRDGVFGVLEKNTGLDISTRFNCQLSPELGLDSMELLQLGLDLEEQFNIEIPDSAVRANMTVGELIDTIRSLAKGD